MLTGSVLLPECYVPPCVEFSSFLPSTSAEKNPGHVGGGSVEGGGREEGNAAAMLGRDPGNMAACLRSACSERQIPSIPLPQVL